MSEEKAAKLRLLRTLVAPPPERDQIYFSHVKVSVPRGSLVEIAGQKGTGRTQMAISLLAEHSDFRAAWIEKRLSVYPRAFPQHKVSLKQILFVESGEHSLWASLQILKSNLFQIIFVNNSVEKLSDLKRLQLAAERSQALVVFVSDTLQKQSWPFYLQIQVQNPKQFQIVRNKGGTPWMALTESPVF